MILSERTDGRKDLFKREKNLPVVILSFREQTLTDIKTIMIILEAGKFPMMTL